MIWSKRLNIRSSGIDICRKLSINRLVNEHILAQVYDALGDSQKALLTIRKAIRETNSVRPTAGCF